MDSPALISAVEKLLRAGEQAGYTSEELVRLLNEGFTPIELLEMIEYRLKTQAMTSAPLGSDQRKKGPMQPFPRA